MGRGPVRAVLAVVLVFLMVSSGLQVALGGPPGGGGDGGGGAGDGTSRGAPTPLDASPWIDEFDDSSLVNTTMDTEVVSGEVRLVAGKATGLVASVDILPPAGHRYDMVMATVTTPGASSVRISVLNASESSTIVGFVNQPIPGFLKIPRTQLILTGVDVVRYPSLRLQADLEAAGTDRPALLMWSVYFVVEDTWQDDFLGDGKIQESSKINVTNGAAEVDLSRQNTYGPGYGNYVSYPPIIASRYSDQSNRLEMGVFYPNTANNDYESRVQLPAENVRGFAAADIDQDGYLDMVVANQRDSSDYTRDSWILWGNDTGRWDTNRRTNLATYAGHDTALGDVNGDGYLDVLISCGGGTGEVRVFLNPKNRSFSNAHDIALPGSDITGLASLDLNSDGYDDVVLAEEYASGGSDYSRIYYGGAGGPDTTADVMLPTGGSVYEVALDDFDGDGNIDVVFANTIQSGGDRAQMFYGSENGPDTTADFEAAVDGTQWGLCVAAGDINGDGWKDIVYGRVMQNARMYVFWGAASGFSNSRTSDPQVDGGSIYDIIVIDVNKDGYDDVIGGNSWGDRIDIYFGSANGIDGNSDKRLNSDAPNPIGVSADKLRYDQIVGSFITDSINRPLDKKWDLLLIEGDFPANTEVEVSVLDAGLQPVLGYQGLKGPDVDLSGVIIPGIHLRVTMKSLDKVTTPRLDRIFVNWMDKDVWREQFYGKAKVNRIMGLDVRDGTLAADTTLGGAQEIVFANLRSDATFNVPSPAYRDAGGLDYLSVPPVNFRVPSGAGDVEVADVNGDGWQDVVFAVYQVSPGNYMADSPVFLGSAVGWDTVAQHKFSTMGARDVLVADLDDDGYVDLVYAQETDGITWKVNSTLFWGSASGWAMKPDVEFVTTGASGVDAADLDGDGLLDLVFACYRDDATTNCDSMAFLQTVSGFDGSSPDSVMTTRGARAVSLGDIDGDSHIDAVFADAFSNGMAEISSQVFWGTAGGAFGSTAVNLPTQGAQDVVVADLNGDGDLDVVFANAFNNTPSYIVDSYIYMGSGSRSFSSVADITLPTLGASGIAVADLDGTGWKDLVFSCQYDGATYELGSRVFLGTSGYGSSPDIELPTRGAMDVTVAELVRKDAGGYMSKVITPDDPDNAGVFETFKYNALGLPAGHTGKVRVLDADTKELLAETNLLSGYNEWSLADKFRIREHDSILVQVTVEGLDPSGSFRLDDLWLNWSPRDKQPPRVLDLSVSESVVLRTRSIEVMANVTDEYDYPDELTVRIEHHRTNTTESWSGFMISGLEYRNDAWRAIIKPRVDIPVGIYDLRVRVVDRDSMDSGWFTMTEAFEVRNNLPTAPEVRIDPARPVVTSTLEATIVSSAFDVESTAITYRYAWSLNGELVPNLTMMRVSSTWLERGQNWSVEVRAFDGDDEGPPAYAWRIIENAGPVVDEALDPVIMDEDVPVERALSLRNAFFDPDGDPITWRVDPPPEHLEVTIDADTGMVSITPEKDWWGTEDVTFVASDGEFDESQVVGVTVRPVNDAPYIVSIDGVPYIGQVYTLTVNQGEELAVDIVAIDVEGDDTLFKGNVTKVKVDLATGRITFTPTNDDVGLVRFRLTVNDNVDTNNRNTVDFIIEVVNVNDPVSETYIISPRKGEIFKWNESVGLRGVGTDPDEKHGQELNFSWSSNVTGFLGYGRSINFRFTDSGRHNVTLTVTDGEHSMTASVEFTVGDKPYVPPDGNGGGGEDELPWTLIIGIVLALVAVLVVVMVLARRKAAREEAAKAAWAAEAEEDTEAEKRRKLAEIAGAVKETADQMEAERAAARAGEGDASIEVSGTGMVPTSKPSHKMRLTERPSDETARLWASMEEETPVVDKAEKEALRLEVDKRKVLTAIQSMPYGIPAPELRHIEPSMLAEEMVSAKHHSLPDGRELVAIRGKWYHGDPEDSSTFLMPYKEPKKKEPSTAASEWEEG